MDLEDVHDSKDEVQRESQEAANENTGMPENREHRSGSPKDSTGSRSSSPQQEQERRNLGRAKEGNRSISRGRSRSRSRSPRYRGRDRRSRVGGYRRSRSPPRRFAGGRRDYRGGRDDRGGLGYRGDRYDWDGDRRGPGPGRGRNAIDRIEPMDTYKVFMMRQDDHGTPEVYQKRYEEYKKKYLQRIMRVFFDDHKNEEWLQLRYSPTIHRAENSKQVALAAQEATAFIDRVKSGESRICFDEPKPSEDPENAEQQYDNDLDASGRLLYIRRVPCFCPMAALREAVAVGGEFQRVFLSNPAKKPQYDFDRCGWILYETPEMAKEAMGKLQNTLIQDPDMPNPIRLQISNHRARAALRAPSCMSLPERISIDLAKATKLVQLLDRDTFGENSCVNTLLEDEAFQQNYATETGRLDVIIAYLRRVHHVIYYSGVQCISAGDVLHTYPAVFVRPPSTERDAEARANNEEWSQWVINLDEKLDAIIDRLDPEKRAKQRDAQEAIVARVEEAEEKELEPVYDSYIVPVGEEKDKHRCNLCTKLFRAAEFVKKHIRNKHPEVVADIVARAGEDSMWQAYREDEHRPMPKYQMNNALLGGGHRGGGRRGGLSMHSNGRGGGAFGRGRGRIRGPPRDSRGPSRLRPDVSNLPVDPRSISTSYQDLDNLRDAKVEVNFGGALGSLPPPKKKAKSD